MGIWQSNRFHWVWLAWFVEPYIGRHVPCVMDDFGTLVPVQPFKALAHIA